MVNYERGFKAWTERISLSIRSDLGILPTEPLAPQILAGHLNVKLITPNDVPRLKSQARDQLLRVDTDGWSAITCKVQDCVVVIFNPTHTPQRQSSDLMHELAHILLNHKLSRIILSPDGKLVMRSYDEKQEAEATWLSGALLLPREALLSIVKDGVGDEEACSKYCVSRQLLRWRMNVTGVRIQTGRIPIRRARSRASS